MSLPNPKPLKKKKKGGKAAFTLFTVATVAILALAVGAIAQTTTPLKGYGFAGARYSHAVIGKDVATGSIGFLTHVGGPVYTAAYADVGQYGKLSNDWILLAPVQPNSKLYVGLLAGPDADFSAVGTDGAIVAYLTGAGGVMAAYQGTGKVLGFDSPGLWAVARYNFKLDNAELFVNGWTVGFGVFLPW